MATTKIRYNQVKTGLPTGGDSNYASTSLILNMDGADGSTSFSDESSKSHTVTATGSAAVSITESKFGGGSLRLDGSSDYLDIPSHVSFDFGSSDFTIEVWVRGDNSISQYYPTFIGSNSGGGFATGASFHRFDATASVGGHNLSQKFWFGLSGVGDPFLISSNTFAKDTWHHYALCRTGNDWLMFINGVLEASGSSAASFNMGIQNGVRIGNTGWAPANENFKGYLDDLRVTKGVARYTSAFSVPTSEHPSFAGYTGKVIVAGEDGTMELQ